MKREYSTLLAALLAACSTAVYADYDPEDEFLKQLYASEQVTGIATGTQKPLYLAPAVASVVTAQDIQKMGATTLDEALNLIPGLHISLSQTQSLNSVFSIRGVHTARNPQVLLSINGVPVRNTFSGARLNSYRLPVANISRIEIIRGPGSAVHGADAFSGVINVITKGADELNGLQVGARLGSFSSKESWFQYGAQFAGDWQFVASIEHMMSNGDRQRVVESDLATTLGKVLPVPSLAGSSDGVLDTRYNILNSRLGISNAAWDISFSNWKQRNAGAGPGIAQVLDPAGTTEADAYLLDLNYHKPERILGWEFGAHFTMQKYTERNRYTIFRPGSVLPIGDDGNLFTAANKSCPNIPNVGPTCLISFADGVLGYPGVKTKDDSFELNSLYKENKKHAVRLAVGFSQHSIVAMEDKNFGPGTLAAQAGEQNVPVLTANDLKNLNGTSDIFIEPQKRHVWYVSGQDEWQVGRDVTFTGGVRYDRYSDFGKTVNPRAAVVWAMDYNLTSKFLLGSAFRAPSFGELYTKNNPVALGNAGLKPEKIHTAELVFDYRPTFTWQHNVNTFYYQAKELIDLVPIAGSTSVRYENIHSQDGYGMELESRWKPKDNIQVSAAFAWQHSENTKTKQVIPDAPSKLFSLAARWNSFDWSLFGSVKWVMDRERVVGDSRAKTGDYAFVNVTARKQFSRTMDMAFSVRNLFNADGREPSNGSLPNDYRLAGRSLFAEVRYLFDKK